jgi:oligosaccharide repeat unit polymerase
MFLLPVITILVIFFVYQKHNNKKFGIISYLILVYAIMGVMSVIINISDLFPSEYYQSLEAMAYMSLCLIIIFFGFFSFKDNRLKYIEIENIYTYKILETFLIIGGFAAIIFFLPLAIQGFVGDIKTNRINISLFQETVIGAFGIINSIFSLIANLFLLSILFSFINFAQGPKYRIRAYLLLISSLSYVVYISAYVGRDGTVYWLMTFLFLFLLMKDFLNNTVKKQIIKLSFLITLIILIPFIIISIARFGSSNFGTIWYLVIYMGQQINNFNDAYQVHAPINYGRSVFPVFLDWIEKIGIYVPNSSSYLDTKSYYLNMNVLPWLFKTYLGDLLDNFGRIGTIVFLIISSFVSKIILRKVNRTGSFSISNLILFILLYQIVLWGVFYFRQSTANYYLLAMILLFIIFKINFNKYNIVKVKKNDK